jgi:molybdopterin-guanine dinucleotide biosynthesis protein A
MEKAPVIIEIDKAHEYTILSTYKPRLKETTSRLMASKNKSWVESLKGTQRLEMLENEDGVEFKELNLKLDYSQASELYIMLKELERAGDWIGVVKLKKKR